MKSIATKLFGYMLIINLIASPVAIIGSPIWIKVVFGGTMLLSGIIAVFSAYYLGGYENRKED